jgi:hypothetical protein
MEILQEIEINVEITKEKKERIIKYIKKIKNEIIKEIEEIRINTKNPLYTNPEFL